jgi:transposase InsO family protein
LSKFRWRKEFGGLYRARKFLGKRLLRELQWKLRDECLNGEIFYSLKEAQIVTEKRRVEYNTRRRHSALGYGPPAPAAYNPMVPPNSISQPESVM